MSDSGASCRESQDSTSACLFRKRCLCRAFSLLGPATPPAGWGYVWVQLQRPRRLTFPPRFFYWLISARCSRQRWPSLALGHPSVHPRQTHTLKCYRLTLMRRTKPSADIGGSAPTRQQDSALSVIAAAVSRSGLSAWKGYSSPSHRTEMPHPQLLLPHVWDISMFSHCLPMVFWPLPSRPDEHFPLALILVLDPFT